jgi:hypothetical protein
MSRASALAAPRAMAIAARLRPIQYLFSIIFPSGIRSAPPCRAGAVAACDQPFAPRPRFAFSVPATQTKMGDFNE